MPQRDQEIAMLRREVEMLMSERQAILHVVGAAAALIAAGLYIAANYVGDWASVIVTGRLYTPGVASSAMVIANV